MKRIASLLLALTVVVQASAQTATTEFVVFPGDTNAMGTLFGGKTMAEMDRCAAIAVRRALEKSTVTQRAATVSAHVDFVKAVPQGELVTMKADVSQVREKTIVVHVTMMAGQIAARGEFVFCAVKDGKGVAHGLEPK